MDQLNAYKILELDANASVEEVKEAYARLSKEYHPEENPEEFQRIHEAYVTLTRRGRRVNRGVPVETSAIMLQDEVEKQEVKQVFPSNTREDGFQENAETKKEFEFHFEESFHSAKNQSKVTENTRNYDFDTSIQQAQVKETEQLIVELDALFASAKVKKLKNFKEFFSRKEYEKGFRSPEFIEHLAECIKKTKLKEDIYSYIISVYQLKQYSCESLIPEAQALYKSIDSRYSIEKDMSASRRLGIYAGVAGGILYPLTVYGPKVLKVFYKAGLDETFVWIGLAIIAIIVFIAIIRAKRK